MINRREALARLGGLIGAGFIGLNKTSIAATTESLTTSSQAASSASGSPFTIAHITDIHITPTKDAEKWFAHCLHHIQSNPAKPQLIINTGDSVMETLTVERSDADALWKLWRGVIERENSLPIKQCLGNHDHWGLALPATNPAKNDLLYGKKRGLEGLGIERAYYSFDQGGWHIIALDTVLPTGTNERPGWTGQLDDEQFNWLVTDLQSIPQDRPVLVYSHLPIIEVCSFKSMKPNEKNEYRHTPLGMLGDARRVIDLFKRHPNVKLCISGHFHLQDHIELSGVTYICDGAVCGAWWKGNHIDCPPGYSTLTLHPDGRFEHKYETYGWAAGTAPA